MGDVFLSTAFNSDPENYGLGVGEGGWTTITHELGHALGLKHPADYNDGTTPPYLENELNDTNHTVMSYTTKDDVVPYFRVDGDKLMLDLDIVYPNLYSLYDIATLQSIYGVNREYNTEDNIYTLEYKNHEIKTIWDAGGSDIIDLSNTKGDTTLDMRGGTINSVDEYSLDDIIKLYQDDVHSQGMNIDDADDWMAGKITYLYNEDLLYTGKDNFSIAQGVIIENINTGAGDDTIIDNEVDNIINTGAGDDKIYLGNGGFDHINGGDGEDSIYLNLLEDEVEIDKIDNQTYSIIADNFYAEIKDIETIYFIGVSHTDLI
jgi:Ca2+-binding RTX toxin-like protein